MLQAYYGIENEDFWRMATGLGAGMSRRGRVCGALTGAIIACGLAVGRRRGSTHADRVGLREETYAKVQELSRRFEERFGTVECLAMTGCDFNTPEGRRRFSETRQMEVTCRPAVQLVVESVPALCD